MRYWLFLIIILFTRSSFAALIHYESTFITTIPPSSGEPPIYYQGVGRLVVDDERSLLLSVFLDCEPFTYSWTGTARLVEEPYWSTETGRVSALHVDSSTPRLSVKFWFDIFYIPEGELAAAHLDNVVEEDSFYGNYWFRSTYRKVSVPEPSTALLFIAGLLGLYIRERTTFKGHKTTEYT